MSSVSLDMYILILLFVNVFSVISSESDTLECFSTLCLRYATRKGCKLCSERILDKKSRQLWAEYMKTLASMEFDKNEHIDFKRAMDKPKCCVLPQQKTDNNRYCMSLTANHNLIHKNQRYFSLR